jgi:hypothetical protein
MNARRTVFALALILSSAAANAQSLAGSLGLIVYPSAGQPPEQQRTDEQECHTWAGETTGVDPEHPKALETPATAEQVDQGAAAGAGVARGLARGALMGNLADDDWEQWAAAGAVAGGVRGAKSAQRRNAQAQANATAEQQAAAAEEVEYFKRAFTACIEGRNYTIT